MSAKPEAFFSGVENNSAGLGGSNICVHNGDGKPGELSSWKIKGSCWLYSPYVICWFSSVCGGIVLQGRR